jgi:hypothetical protein
MNRSSRSLAVLFALALPLVTALSEDCPEPTSAVTPEGFKKLFTGKDLTGWEVLDGKTEVWKAANGVLFTGRNGGWLMTEKEYGDFELRLQFKLAKASNSGVALRAPMEGDPAVQGMEIQILDDDAHTGLEKSRYTGSIYGVVPASKQPARPIGLWNSYRIVCKSRKVTIELNGEKVVDANLDDYRKVHGRSRPGILRDKGHIGLQGQIGGSEFRNIFLKELK